MGTVRGFDVALPIHFHYEDQITFVLSGSRRFIIGDELVKIGPDEGAQVPAGVPHRSLVEDSEMFCININTSPGDCCTQDLIASLASMPPQSFQLIEKLNDARRLLRKGDSIADVAVQTGFADQSRGTG